MTDASEGRAPAAAGAPHLRLLPAFVGDTGHSKAGYIVKAWLLTLLPSLALAALVGTVFGALFGEPRGPSFPHAGPALVFMLVLFSPVVETLIMVPPLLVLNRLLGPGPAAVLSAAGWGIVHSLQAPTWGLVIWWAFFVFSWIILAWRKSSLLTGILIVMIVHAMQNAVPALLLLLARGG